MTYQHDLICCLDAKANKNAVVDEDRIKQDKAIIAELKNIFYGERSDGLVFIE